MSHRRRPPRELPRDEVFVAAPQEICFQVVASAGRVLERRDEGEKLVEFETTVGRNRVVTKELVRPREFDRIDYEWLEGPLPVVEETIWVDPAEGGATLRYEGRFRVDAPWPLRALLERYVAKRFAEAVHEHLLDAKRIAEQRAARSKRYPRR